MTIRTVNPTTGELVRSFEPLSDSALEAKLQCAAGTFRSWRALPFAARARLMREAARILEERKQDYARLMTLEMGKLIGAAVQEVEKCARGCRFYAEHAERFLADEPAETDATRTFVRYQPLGPVLAVMPWNFPFWQVFRFAAPALMAGNVALLKHASNVPQCALAIEDLFRRAGFPEGAFQTLLVGPDRVPRLVDDPRVAAVTLTGSVGAGSSVAAAAGRAIKKSVLELGGSDPFIVMPSADLERAVAIAVQARTINNGQSCIAAKRFIVHRAIAGEFERRFAERMRALRVGDPLDPATELGPLATEEVREGLDRQVRRTLEAGARLLAGGGPLDRPGFFYAPTVLADVPRGTPAYHDELFGPVAALFPARDLEHALDLANDTGFGLGASLWSEDPREHAVFIDRIEAGLAFVNGMVASDPRAPFGGVKRSGFGRELGPHGIREFVNVKTVAVYETAGGPGAGGTAGRGGGGRGGGGGGASATE